MADEIWCALDAHVKKHGSNGDGRVMMDVGPQPDMSMPKGDNVFDNLVDDIVAESAEEEVEEVLDEGREEPRMAGSDMFGHYRKQE